MSPPQLRPWIGRALFVLSVMVLSPQRAAAGPVEQLVEIVFPPGDSSVTVARYINGGGGLLWTDNETGGWQLQCLSAFLSQGTAGTGPLMILGDGSMLFRSSGGLMKGDRGACNWQLDSGELTKDVNDFVQHPDDPNVVFATRVNPMAIERVGLLRRDAAGAWTELGSPDVRSPVSVRVTKMGDALRIYELALQIPAMGSAPAPAMYILRVSDDDGATWREHPLTLEGGGTPRLRGVDPSDPNRIVLAVSRPGAMDTILISKDQGATVETYLEIGDFGGLTFAPDGRIWIGDLGSSSGGANTPGLYAAANLGAAPARLPMGDYTVQCLNYRASNDTLNVCQRFWLGTADPVTGAFTQTLRLTEVQSFVTCEGKDLAAMCQAQLCGDFCGPAHFAVAPVCSAYDMPGCGIPVAREEGGTSGAGGEGPVASAPAATAGAGSGAAGSGGAGSGAAGAATGRAGAGAAGAAPGGSGTTASASDGGGCGVGTSSGNLRSGASAAMLVLGLLAAGRRWRQRSKLLKRTPKTK